jgi:hypothetical protein
LSTEPFPDPERPVRITSCRALLLEVRAFGRGRFTGGG